MDRNEAINIVKSHYPANKQMLNEALEFLIPELTESEDEKIRKELIKHLKEGAEGYIPAGDNDDYQRWLAWLEKQGEKDEKEINNFEVIPGSYKCVHRMFDGTPDGKLLFEVGNVYKCLSKHDRAEFEVSYGHSVYLEDPVVCKHFIPFEKQDEHKLTVEMKTPEESLGIDSETYNEIVDECIYGKQEPTDKIKSKFKVGDWITNGQLTCKVLSVISKSYELHLYNDDYCHFETDVQNVDKDYHLWTIADAKDGDVLSNGEIIVIFKHFEEPSYRQHIVAYIGLDTCGDIQITNDTWYLGVDKTKPATKEQRDLLFQKMHEAGLEWNTDKKEPRKIEQKPTLRERYENISKSEWFKKTYDGMSCGMEEDKVNWSEEDEKILKATINTVLISRDSCEEDDDVKDRYDDELRWLKSLKQRIGGEK